ncbi:MAG: glutathione S-transferase family protein [Myxococcota bacterium]
MRLLQFPFSPFAAKLRTCLAAKKLKCEVVNVPYLDRREVVAATGKVMIPVLIDGDTVVSDSARITAYLDEKYAPSLRAGPLGSLAVVFEQWADEMLEETAFRLACPGIEALIGKDDPGREAEARAMYRLIKERRYGAGCIEAWRRDEARYSEQVVAMLEPIVDAVKQRPYILGESLSLADAAVASQLFMVEVAKPGWVAEQVPALVPWYARVRA